MHPQAILPLLIVALATYIWIAAILRLGRQKQTGLAVLFVCVPVLAFPYMIGVGIRKLARH